MTRNRKWVTLRRWGDVHAGGESCARAGEGVTLEKLLQLTIVAPSGSITGLGPASIETDRQHLHQLRMVHDSMSLS